MVILVTGGAGYIGSILAEELLKQGYRVIVLDNLRQGHREAVPPGAEFIQADITDYSALEGVFKGNKIEAVMHLAAETSVEHSMLDPGRFFRSNVLGGINLLEAMVRYGVLKLIFSSTAAVYGEPQTIPIEEDHRENPINAYGESKLMFEHLLSWYGKAYGLKYISLRYFNAAGASSKFGEDHRPETHLIPNVLKAALGQIDFVPIYGLDYPTRDGSCLRDYIHVIDIAWAHILALENIDKFSGQIYNLGNERGYSVLEVIQAAKEVTGVDIPTKIMPRRLGDPAALVASSRKVREELGWQPRFPELEAIIVSAWKWLKTHPNGYRK